ncbi:CFEM domain-containing protein [Podospora didyma]|uniref:CFEM domain-containing protein n=1 Tax=Podospora didyma TaxID=330526 RepID=A0AAE0NTY8_9PEZI|nr:CFEM domain-containing protein [Podospora didyma]
MRAHSTLPVFSTSLTTTLLILLFPLLVASQRDTNGLLLSLAARVPACGSGCLEQLLNTPTSDSSSDCFKPGTNTTTCLCEDDISHYTTVLNCVQANCTLEESIETARGAWEACGKPQRSRKADLLAPLSIEIPALICVILRLYSRWWSVSHFEVDDYIMMAVTLLYIVFEGVGITAGQMAFGVDVWTVDSSVLTLAFKFFYIDESFYLSILALTKISILCFYLRIFPDRMFRLVSYAVMAWVVVSGIMFVFLQIFQCIPIPFIWEGWKGGVFGPYRRLDISALAFTTAGFSIAQDIVILIMPLPLLARLNVSRRSRCGIMVMFSLGIFVLITSCVRVWAIYGFGDSVNPTWDYTDALIWTGLEVAVSIIVTSLPAIRVLISRRDNLFGSLSGSRRRQAADFRDTSTSSFGDTTVVGSWHGAPPTLKRLSAISRLSSIKVGTPSQDDLEKHESTFELGDKMTRHQLACGGGGGGSRASDIGRALRLANQQEFRPPDVDRGQGRRMVYALPNISSVVLNGRPASSPSQFSWRRPSITHVETATTTASAFVSDSWKGAGH